MRGIVIGLTLLLWALSAFAEPGTIVLRGGTVIEASDVSFTDQAVTIEANSRRISLAWPEIADVSGPARGAMPDRLGLAERAWRGLSRLERGDRVAAEPALEDAFNEAGRGVGATSKVIAEGLLACRLARGAQALAVEPLVYVILNRTRGDQTDGFDPDYGLPTTLPPIWGARSGLSSMVQALGSIDFDAYERSERARQIATIYLASALHEISGQAELPAFTPTDDGVRFLQEMTLARIGNESEREAMRAALESRLTDEAPEWIRAWARAGIGMSLLMEQDTRSGRLGIVQLLHVPALYGQSQPYLAGVCLSRAAVRLEEMGRRDEALLLARTFRQDFNEHEAGRMPAMRELLRSLDAPREGESPEQENA